MDTGSGSTGSPPGGYSVQATAAIAAAITFLVLFTIAGNALVIMAVLSSRSLQAPQNLFLVSLAAADILVATLIIPFSLANELLGYWYFERTWCEIYLALDVLFCTSSIVHLCAISLDRYWAVSRAIEYNAKRTPRRIKCGILIVWTIAAAISLPPLVYKGEKKAVAGRRPQCKLNEEAWYILSSSVGSFFAPCLIMILVYLRIYLIARRRHRARSGATKPPPVPPSIPVAPAGVPPPADRTSLLSPPSAGAGTSPAPMGPRRDTVATGTGRVVLARRPPALTPWRRKAQVNREKRFTFVLAVVIGVFVLCWFPFFFLYSLGALCPRRCKVPDGVFQFFFWIGYCNSSLNPVIYTVFNQDFRKAFRRLLCRCRAPTPWDPPGPHAPSRASAPAAGPLRARSPPPAASRAGPGPEAAVGPGPCPRGAGDGAGAEPPPSRPRAGPGPRPPLGAGLLGGGAGGLGRAGGGSWSIPAPQPGLCLHQHSPILSFPRAHPCTEPAAGAFLSADPSGSGAE